MKFIFIDAENIGLKEVENIEASIIDKVFVYSKNSAIKKLSEKKMFINVSNYPSGSNQADFDIIANLISVIFTLKKFQLENCEFVLYSQDSYLVKAFTFQCDSYSVKTAAPMPPKDMPATEHAKIIPIKQKVSVADQILEVLKEPMTSSEIEKRINASKSDFTKAFNNLIKNKKIERKSITHKTWTVTLSA